MWFPSLEPTHGDWRHGNWRVLHHTHVVVLLDSRSGSVFFRCSAGLESGGTSYTPYVCEYYEVLHVRHSSSLERLHGHEVVMGVRLHRQRSDGDVIPSSVYEDRVAAGVVRGSSRHRGWASTTTSTTFTRERFPLNGLHKGMSPIPTRYSITPRWILGIGHMLVRKNYCFLLRLLLVLVIPLC